MKGEGLETKMFCIGQDKITYKTLKLNVNVIVTSFLYATLRHSLIDINAKYERCGPEGKKVLQWTR